MVRAGKKTVKMQTMEKILLVREVERAGNNDCKKSCHSVGKAAEIFVQPAFKGGTMAQQNNHG